MTDAHDRVQAALEQRLIGDHSKGGCACGGSHGIDAQITAVEMSREFDPREWFMWTVRFSAPGGAGRDGEAGLDRFLPVEEIRALIDAAVPEAAALRDATMAELRRRYLHTRQGEPGDTPYQPGQVLAVDLRNPEGDSDPAFWTLMVLPDDQSYGAWGVRVSDVMTPGEFAAMRTALATSLAAPPDRALGE